MTDIIIQLVFFTLGIIASFFTGYLIGYERGVIHQWRHGKSGTVQLTESLMGAIGRVATEAEELKSQPK